MPEVFPNFVVASWTPDGALPIPLAVTDTTKEIENGLTGQRRP